VHSSKCHLFRLKKVKQLRNYMIQVYENISSTEKMNRDNFFTISSHPRIKEQQIQEFQNKRVMFVHAKCGSATKHCKY